MYNIEDLKNKAYRLGATEFGLSSKKNKRFYVIYNGKYINFGSEFGNTYADHKDELKRINYRKRHSKIIDKNGIPFYTLKTSPAFWSYHVLW
jgi:hypothetical protein